MSPKRDITKARLHYRKLLNSSQSLIVQKQQRVQSKMQRYYEDKEIVQEYSRYRPLLSDQVRVAVMDYLKSKTKGCQGKYDMLLDVGCGGGQATQLFASDFKKVVGIDVSQNQIDDANRKNCYDHVKYQVGHAEKLDFENDSVDLIISVEAAHWFNVQEFLAEAFRVLKPGGCIAVIGYLPPTFIPQSYLGDKAKVAAKQLEIGYSFLKEVPKERMQSYLHVASRYQNVLDLMPVYDKCRLPDLELSFKWSKKHVLGFMRSMDMVVHLNEQRYNEVLQKNGEVTYDDVKKIDVAIDYFNIIAKEFSELQNPDATVNALFQVFTVAGSK
uniref:Uncharacterized protein LOC100183251 n=1 Tax=Phallusia mammillata TaxID=59560 RepID=A0A6F9DH40_9ASCI|nr:uncharacterized protein LOC100183251 [Phallusia mammillata]